MTFRVSSAHEEAGDRVYAVSTREFLGDFSTGSGERGAAVRALQLVGVDAQFQPVAGTERELPAQLVLLAMGFTGPQHEGLVAQLGVELDQRGNVARDADYSSSVPGVFVAGDAGRGQSLIVWAIAEGRSAAAAVDRHLTGDTSLPSPIPPTARPLVV
jgi:glutamate synthase (NADPH/NADH) small chain